MLPRGRVGLGTMRLAGGEQAAATIHAALDAGITLFDTARAYGEGERWLGAALTSHAAGGRAFVVTKGGMARPEGAWRADGRARAIQRDCEASLAALGRPIDLYLAHAPDPRVAWATTVRALGRLLDRGLVRAVGVCNVTLGELDEALALAPVAAVQVGLSLLDDRPRRAGVLDRCRERGIAVIAHSPLGGPRRARSLLASPAVAEVAARLGAPPAAVALAALLAAYPEVVAIPGARSADAARQVAAAETLVLDGEAQAALAPSFAAPSPSETVGGGEVVMVMGLPGAGKSALAEQLVAEGFERLNRDQLGGSLTAIARRLAERLADGARRVVLDNTYLTRAARAEVLAIAARHGATVRGLYIDAPLAEAQRNVVWRMLQAHGRLLASDELRRGRDNTAIGPGSLFRLKRELERPTAAEGFASLEVRPFVRAPRPAGGQPARFVTLDRIDRAPAELLRASFVVGWAPDAPPDLEVRLAERCRGVALCRHGGGPPTCWCRPPLPGLLVALAHAHDLDLAASELHGARPAHRALAAAVGARFVDDG